MEKITFGDNLPGYEAGDKSAPAVVVLQEWWGVNDMIKETAQMISKQGFRVLIPDLYKGKVGVDKEEASHLMNELDFKQAINEMTAAVDHLRSSGSKKVGVVGFCMGGALAFCAAQHSGVDAAVPFYGTPDPAVCQPESIKVPVQAHFGRLDSMKGFSDPETVAPLMEKIKAAGVNLEYYSYDSAGHGFMNALLGDMGIAKIEGDSTNC